MNLPLRGCTVVVTREQRGELGRLLDAAGATVVHVPLIEVVDADPDGLDGAWATEPEWLVVTSVAGAERAGTEAARRPGVRLAAVGSATARHLAAMAGRAVDLVPPRQRAEELVAAFNRRNPGPQRVLVAQADRAGSTLVDGLRDAGHAVTAVVAYRTLVRRPTEAELRSIARCDAVAFASGSAALGWADAIGTEVLPPLVVAIGPTTAAAAADAGVAVTHVADDHSLAGLLDALIGAWDPDSSR